MKLEDPKGLGDFLWIVICILFVGFLLSLF